MIAQEAEATEAKQPEAIRCLPNAGRQNPAPRVGTRMQQESQLPQLTHHWLQVEYKMYSFEEGWIGVLCSMTHTCVNFSRDGTIRDRAPFDSTSYRNHVTDFFNCAKDHASMTAAGECHTL